MSECAADQLGTLRPCSGRACKIESIPSVAGWRRSRHSLRLSSARPGGTTATERGLRNQTSNAFGSLRTIPPDHRKLAFSLQTPLAKKFRSVYLPHSAISSNTDYERTSRSVKVEYFLKSPPLIRRVITGCVSYSQARSRFRHEKGTSLGLTNSASGCCPRITMCTNTRSRGCPFSWRDPSEG